MKKDKVIQKLIYSHRTHYLKWSIGGDISIRYHFVFQDQLDLVNKFILKDHKAKKYQLLDSGLAKSIINDIGGEPIEIMGSLTDGSYKKLIKLKDGSFTDGSFTEEVESKTEPKGWYTHDQRLCRFIDDSTYFLEYYPGPNSTNIDIRICVYTSGRYYKVLDTMDYSYTKTFMEENCGLSSDEIGFPQYVDIVNAKKAKPEPIDQHLGWIKDKTKFLSSYNGYNIILELTEQWVSNNNIGREYLIQAKLYPKNGEHIIIIRRRDLLIDSLSDLLNLDEYNLNVPAYEFFIEMEN